MRPQDASADTRCEPLFLQLLAADPPRTQFASDAQRHDYHFWLVRTVLQGTGAMALFGCLLWSGRQLYEAYQLNQEVEVITAETSLARTALRGHRQDLPAHSDQQREPPSRSSTATSNWKMPAPRRRTCGVKSAARARRAVDRTRRYRVEGEPHSRRGTPWARRSAMSRQVSVTRDRHRARHLRLGADSNPRQVLAVFNRLVDALERNPQLQVEVLQQPFDVESGKPLKGGDAALEDSSRALSRCRSAGAWIMNFGCAATFASCRSSVLGPC
jgi:hypothetical protein